MPQKGVVSTCKHREKKRKKIKENKTKEKKREEAADSLSVQQYEEMFPLKM